MSRIRVAAAAAVLAAAAAGAGEPAGANHPSGRKLEAWVASADVSAVYADGFECVMNFRTGVIERGKHGVQRFKVRPRIYAGDTGYAPEWINSWARSIYFDGGWTYTNLFPNDRRSFSWGGFRRNWRFGMGTANYTLVVRSVGIRPSWWQADLKHDLKVGICRYSVVDLGS